VLIFMVWSVLGISKEEIEQTDQAGSCLPTNETMDKQSKICRGGVMMFAESTFISLLCLIASQFDTRIVGQYDQDIILALGNGGMDRSFILDGEGVGTLCHHGWITPPSSPQGVSVPFNFAPRYDGSPVRPSIHEHI
jgi:hypothetical protein